MPSMENRPRKSFRISGPAKSKTLIGQVNRGDHVIFRSPLKGVIRREDVRQTEKDRVELSKCFRPSDIVMAKIISLGDQNNYLLSTAADELGS